MQNKNCDPMLYQLTSTKTIVSKNIDPKFSHAVDNRMCAETKLEKCQDLATMKLVL